MTVAAIVYRDLIVRMVLGDRPAVPGKESDPAALDRLCKHLADCEEANTVLRGKGYGAPGMLIHEVAASVPMKV